MTTFLSSAISGEFNTRALSSGSTHSLTPVDFMRDLMVLELGGIGSKALPNGVPELNEPVRSPQEIYDQRFYTKDAPPRRPAPAPSPQPGGGNRLLGRPSPVSSNAGSSGSVNSTNYSNSTASGETEKKKKRGFLRF